MKSALLSVEVDGKTTEFPQVQRVAVVGMNRETLGKRLPDLNFKSIFPNANAGSVVPALTGATLEALRLFFASNKNAYDLIFATAETIDRTRTAVFETLSDGATIVELPNPLPNPEHRFDEEHSHKFNADVASTITEILARVHAALSTED